MKSKLKFPSIRTIKTGIAVASALAIANFFSLETPFLSGISALMTVNDSVSDSFKTALYRLTATILGATIACIFHFFEFTNSFAIGLAIILLIQIFIILGWQRSIIAAGIVTISIMLFIPDSHESFIFFSISKIIDTFVGVAIGFLVNYLLFPPRRESFLIDSYREILDEFVNKLGELLEKEGDIHLSPLVLELNSITSDTLTLEADDKFIKKTISSSDIWKINTLYYKLFSLISQLTDKKQIVPLTDKNKDALEKLLHRKIVQRYEDNDPEYEKIFNLIISRILNMVHLIEKNLQELEKIEN